MNNPADLRNKNKSWNMITSQSQRIVSLVDLAGHEKYLRTTVTALIGVYPDIALVVINPSTGVSRMTREHIGLAVALKLRMMVVVTKIDRAEISHLKQVRKEIITILQSAQAGRTPMTIKDEADVKACVNSTDDSIVPVFYVSSVTGQSFNLLHSYLSRVHPCVWNVTGGADSPSSGDHAATTTIAEDGISGGATAVDNTDGVSIPTTESSTASCATTVSTVSSNGNIHPSTGHLLHRDVILSAHQHATIAMEMRVDDRFQVKHHGLVLSGTITIGSAYINQKAFLGPFGRQHAEFLPVTVRSIHMHRHNVNSASLGEGISLCVKYDKTRANKKSKIAIHKDITKDMITKGMVVIAMKDVDPTTLVPAPGVLTNQPQLLPAVACGADIELYILNNHSTMHEKYQAILHCGSLSIPMAFDQVLVAVPNASITGKQDTSPLVSSSNRLSDVFTDTTVEEIKKRYQLDRFTNRTVSTSDPYTGTSSSNDNETTSYAQTTPPTTTTLRSGDRAIVRVRFLQNRWAYVREGEIILLREGSTKALGRIVQIHTNTKPFIHYTSSEKI